MYSEMLIHNHSVSVSGSVTMLLEMPRRRGKEGQGLIHVAIRRRPRHGRLSPRVANCFQGASPMNR